MLYRFLDKASYFFDSLEHTWEREPVRKFLAAALSIIFLVSLACIELKRFGWLPEPMAAFVPNNHFYAVNLAFTLVLVWEVISLIFVLPCSFSRSVGKQFEILALILLRSSFKELVYFKEPLVEFESLKPVLLIMSDCFGALFVFLLLGIYYRQRRILEKKREEKGRRPQKEGLYEFIAAKKIMALILAASFIGMAGVTLLENPFDLNKEFFAAFYTLLIFSDILLLLLSQRFHPSFEIVFRNSGYALATMLIRLALAAPAFYNAAIGVTAGLFTVLMGVILSYLYAGKEAEGCR